VSLDRLGHLPRIDMQDYTPAARAYWWVVVILGMLAIGHSIAAVAQLDVPSLAQVLVLAGVAAVVGLFPVRIPGAKTSFGGAEIFIFLSLLLYGAPAAVLATALEGAVGAWRTSKRMTSRLISPALAGLAMLVCGTAFDNARKLIDDAAVNGNALVSMVLLFALVLYAANTFLTSLLFAFKNDRRITPVRWLRDNGWIGLAYVSGAAISGLLYATFQQFGLSFLLISVPVLAMFLTTLHAYFEHKVDDEGQIMRLKESESRFHSAFADAALGMGVVAATTAVSSRPTRRSARCSRASRGRCWARRCSTSSIPTTGRPSTPRSRSCVPARRPSTRKCAACTARAGWCGCRSTSRSRATGSSTRTTSSCRRRTSAFAASPRPSCSTTPSTTASRNWPTARISMISWAAPSRA